jgi:hypothetical protein
MDELGLFDFYRDYPWIAGALLVATGTLAVWVARRTRRGGGVAWLMVTAVIVLGAAIAAAVPFIVLVATCIGASDCV